MANGQDTSGSELAELTDEAPKESEDPLAELQLEEEDPEIFTAEEAGDELDEGTGEEEEISIAAKAPLKHTDFKFGFASTPVQDAYDYTFGLIRVDFLSKITNTKPGMTRYVILNSNIVPSKAELSLYERMCKDIQLSGSSTKYVPLSSKAKAAFLVWRSHYSTLGAAYYRNRLYTHSAPVSCGIILTQKGKTLQSIATYTFSPYAVASNYAIGTKNKTGALNEGLILPSIKKLESKTGKKFYRITSVPAAKYGVKALKAKDIVF